MTSDILLGKLQQQERGASKMILEGLFLLHKVAILRIYLDDSILKIDFRLLQRCDNMHSLEVF